MSIKSGRIHLRQNVSKIHQSFQKDLGTFTLTLLTIGGIMGSGLFMASGLAIKRAGPSILVLYAIGWIAMYLEISALGEMSIASPTPGSFLNYTKVVLGPGWTFVAGWIFWFSSVLTMSSEVTAASLFSRLWFPQVALWIWSLSYSIFIVSINFISVRGFGTIEGVMAGVKSIAVLLFVGVGALAVTHILPLTPHHIAPCGFSSFTHYGGWIPHGWLGAAPAFLLVLFAYAGTGVIGLAAAETKNPGKTIARTIRWTIGLVFVMYLGSMILILNLVPWNHMSSSVSPFVLAIRATHIPYGAAIMNLVLLFAVLSTMNAALYSNVRVLYGLAHANQAPKLLGKLNKKGVPANAIWMSAGLLALTIVLAYVLPAKAYGYLVTATGFQAMFIWFMVLLTQLYYRPYLKRHHPERLTYTLWGFPYTTYLVIAIIFIGLLASPFAQGEAMGAIVGFAGILVAWIAWLFLRHRLKEAMNE
ncbi:amino acid permease [Sulfobacillus thermosulfidooxidans]|uniref:amino acid permease n=1 Tax=Sulfobacillus thermosulfidooxidans TaxID=28034 RepID=UPI0006B55DF5|nr:amino acid permease [Sulfobacillus thermosulfidooxidans]